MLNVLEFVELQTNRCQLLHPVPPKLDHPPLVMLPGMDGTGVLQYPQAQRLEQHYDVRCLSIPVDDQRPWTELTDEVLDRIESEFRSRQGEITLFGESFGACLALKLVLRSPRLFRRVVLVNSASAFQHTTLIRWGANASRWIPESLYPASCVGLLPFLAMLNNLTSEARQALLTAMQAVTQQSAQWRMNLLQNLNISDAQLRRISIPTLIIASQSDRLLPSVDEAKRLNRHIPHATVHYLPGRGHACLLEDGFDLRQILQAYNWLPSPETFPTATSEPPTCS
jgi:pimeloyl-ACP methyl ester carboxylesterase